MSFRVAIAMTEPGFPNYDQETEILQSIGASVEIKNCYTVDEVISFCQTADAIIVNHSPITKDVMPHLKKCKVIVRYGIGYDNVDIQAAAQHNIPVVNVPDYGVQEVADHTIALMLSTIRKIPTMDQNIRNGEWHIATVRPIMGLRDKVLGLAGFGNIAREVARRAHAFNFKILAYDPYVSEEICDTYHAQKVDFEELITTSDVISSHLPLLDTTKHLFSRHTFQKMKKNAYLINTSRGGVIHTDELVEALQNGTIAGAGLDVFEQEPLPASHPIFSLKQCVLSAHTAWYSEDSMVRLQHYAALEVKRVLTGEKPKYIVNGVTIR
jgi:D-3-phosphoglycerate dehydrogenase